MQRVIAVLGDAEKSLRAKEIADSCSRRGATVEKREVSRPLYGAPGLR
jgi:hypothetical protein